MRWRRWPAFSIENPIPLPNLRRAVNRLLPAAIRVLSTAEAHADFHPRFDAVSKTYEYRIVRAEVCSPFEWPYVYHHPYPLDEELMPASPASSKVSTISPPLPPPTRATPRVNPRCAPFSLRCWSAAMGASSTACAAAVS